MSRSTLTNNNDSRHSAVDSGDAASLTNTASANNERERVAPLTNFAADKTSAKTSAGNPEHGGLIKDSVASGSTVSGNARADGGRAASIETLTNQSSSAATASENPVRTASLKNFSRRKRTSNDFAAGESTTQTVAPNNAAASGVAISGNAPEPSKVWLLRRGHLLSFIGIYLFTAMLYFRPYELSTSLEFLTTAAWWLAFGTLAIFFPSQFLLEGNLTARPREVNLILMLLLLAVLSLAVARDFDMAWKELTEHFIKAVIIFIVVINTARTERRFRALLYLTFAASVYLSFRGFNDYLSGNLTTEGYRISGALGGMFGNPNDLALHLVTSIPLAILLGLTGKIKAWRIFYFACAGLMCLATMVTYSRGGFLGLVAIGGTLAWKFGRERRILTVVAALIVLPLAMVLAPGGYGSRLGTIAGGDQLGSAGQRQTLLKQSIIVAFRNPVLGIGIGCSPAVLSRNLESHNAYTQVAAETGIAAFLCYLFFIVTPFRRLKQIENGCDDTEESVQAARRALHAQPSSPASRAQALTLEKRSLRARHMWFYSVCLQASLVGYMVSSFFLSVAYQWYIYYLVAYAICAWRLYESQFGELPSLKQEKAELKAQQRKLIGNKITV